MPTGHMKKITVDVLPKTVTFTSLGASFTAAPGIIISSTTNRGVYTDDAEITADQFVIRAFPGGPSPPFDVYVFIVPVGGATVGSATGSTLNLTQMSTRLRSMRWQIPGLPQPLNLWGGEGKKLVSFSLMTKLINQALTEWALETHIPKNVWTLDDGSGGEGTLTAKQRKYTLPSDVLFLNQAFVAYKDANNFEGYPLVLVDQPFLDSTLSHIDAISVSGPGVVEYNYSAQTLAAGTTFPHKISFASLGVDANGNTPPSSFNTAPFFVGIDATVDVDIRVTNVSLTDFTIDVGAFSSANLPYDISFTFREIGGSLLQLVTTDAGLPQRMFIWKDEFWLDPVPAENYTFRMYGYELPTSLSADTDIPGAMQQYHESIFLKCKRLIARELNVLNESQIVGQYLEVAAIAKKADEARHHVTRIVQNDGGYWINGA